MEADASDALSVELMTRKVCLWNDVDVKGIEKTLSTAEIAGRINYVEREGRRAQTEKALQHKDVRCCCHLHLSNRNLALPPSKPGPQQGG